MICIVVAHLVRTTTMLSNITMAMHSAANGAWSSRRRQTILVLTDDWVTIFHQFRCLAPRVRACVRARVATSCEPFATRRLIECVSVARRQ